MSVAVCIGSVSLWQSVILDELSFRRKERKAWCNNGHKNFFFSCCPFFLSACCVIDSAKGLFAFCGCIFGTQAETLKQEPKAPGKYELHLKVNYWFEWGCLKVKARWLFIQAIDERNCSIMFRLVLAVRILTRKVLRGRVFLDFFLPPSPRCFSVKDKFGGKGKLDETIERKRVFSRMTGNFLLLLRH